MPYVLFTMVPRNSVTVNVPVVRNSSTFGECGNNGVGIEGGIEFPSPHSLYILHAQQCSASITPNAAQINYLEHQFQGRGAVVVDAGIGLTSNSFIPPSYTQSDPGGAQVFVNVARNTYSPYQRGLGGVAVVGVDGVMAFNQTVRSTQRRSA